MFSTFPFKNVKLQPITQTRFFFSGKKNRKLQENNLGAKVRTPLNYYFVETLLDFYQGTQSFWVRDNQFGIS